MSVPVASDQGLAGVVTDKTTPDVRDVVEAVWDRYYHRSRPETPYEQRYDAGDRDGSERAYLAAAVEMTRGREERSWLRSSSSSPRATLADARASVLEEHQSHLREIFEVACDEVFGRGALGERLRRRREQVEQAVDAAERRLPTTQVEPFRPDHRVPAVSEDTMDGLVAEETDPFLKEMFGVVWERYYRRAGLETPYEERYAADDRRRSELAHLDAVIQQTLEQQRRLWLASTTVSEPPTLASARASDLKDYRSWVRGIFTTARDDVLRGDELRDRQPPVQSARPAGASGERRAADEPPTESPPTSSAPDRTPRGGEPERPGEAEPDSTSGRGRDAQDSHPLPATAPDPKPAAVSVTEADSERTESAKNHLRPAVDAKHQEALGQYEKAKAERGIFTRRPPEPTWAEAETEVVKEFESELLGVIEGICHEVQQQTPAAVRFELERFEPQPVSTPQPSRLGTRTTKQPGPGRLRTKPIAVRSTDRYERFTSLETGAPTDQP